MVAPDVTHIFGDYWDVYRMSFLSGKKIDGIPYPMYPNRFPGWSRGLGPAEGKLLAVGIRRAFRQRNEKAITGRVCASGRARIQTPPRTGERHLGRCGKTTAATPPNSIEFVLSFPRSIEWGVSRVQ